MSAPTAPKFDGTQPCAKADPELFFPTDGGGAGSAKAVCAGCPFKGLCLAYALKHRIRFGVWGGKTEHERKKMQRHLWDAA